jgi:hypothetical protein
MKKTLLMAAVIVLAGCGEKKAEAPAADTAAMAPATTPADTGTGMGGMAHDSGMTTSDTTMARDTTAK